MIFALQLLRPVVGIDLTVDILHSVGKETVQRLIRKGYTGRLWAIRPRYHFHLAQHHIRVVDEITVHGDTVVIRPQLPPVWLNVHHAVTFLQEQNIRYHFRTCCRLEGIVGQADRAQQLRPLGDIFPHAAGALVHGVAGGDERHHAARSHLIQRLGEEVLVDGQVQPVIAPILHFELAKGNVAHRRVKEVVGEIHLFIALHGNAAAGVQLTGDASGNVIQLHAVELTLRHALRQHTEEMTDAAGRLQHVALPEAHLLQRGVDAVDHHRRRIEGGQCGFPRRGVLCFGQQAFQFLIPAVLGIEAVRQTAPAHIRGQDLLLLHRGEAILRLHLLQKPYCCHVVGIPLTGRYCTQSIVGDAVVDAARRQRGGGFQPLFFSRQVRDRRHRRLSLRCLLPLLHLRQQGYFLLLCRFLRDPRFPGGSYGCRFLLRLPQSTVVPMVKQAERTVNVFRKLFPRLLAGIIVPVSLVHAIQIDSQGYQHFRRFCLIRQLLLNDGNGVIVVHTLGVWSRHIVRCIRKAEIHCPRQLPPFILRNCGNGILAGETLLRDEPFILLDHIGNAQLDFIILFPGIFPLIGQSLIGFRIVISIAPAAAVLTKTAFDEFLLLLLRVGIAEKGIHVQAAVHRLRQEELVYLILCDEHFAPAQEIRLRGKAALRQVNSVQHHADPVCTILRQSKTHDAAILLIGVQKGVVFLSQSRKAALALGEGHHILVQLRITLALVVDGQRLGEQTLCAALLSQIAGGHQQGIAHLKQHLVLRLLQLWCRKVRSRLQQLQYPRRRLLPRHRGAAVPGMNAIPLRQMNTVLHEPHGIFLTFIFDAASVFRAELTAQKCRTFCFRTLAHIEHRDPLRAAAAVARCIQRLVDNRLRHRASGKQLTRSLRLRHFIDRRAAAHAKEGHLLRHYRRILQAQLDLIRAPLNKVFGHFRDHAP